MPPVALTIAGSDPSGGAGIQADLKTFHELRVYGTSAITLLTVQNTMRVSRVECVAPALISEQIGAVLEDLNPAAVKTGALGSAPAILAVAAVQFSCPLVVDPVMISKHGARLLDDDAVDALRKHMLPKAALVTPNIEEARALSGIAIENIRDMARAASYIASYGPDAVLIKGGHLNGDAIDLLWQSGRITEFPAPRIVSVHTHGTGCTLSAAITAYLARGVGLCEAVAQAKLFITRAIQTAPGVGSGSGPVNHWANSPDPI